MSEDDDSRSGVLPRESRRDWDLPRIVVEEDNIFVFEDGDDIVDSGNEWVERDVEKEVVGEEDLDDDSDGVELNVVLEEVVGGDNLAIGEDRVVGIGIVEEKADSFYKGAGGVGSYEAGLYDEANKSEIDYKALMEGKGSKDSFGFGVVDVEEARRGGRSMLEISGFRDEEAEKKRRERREGNFK